ncbi:baseplate multidomain protein megatron [Primorskyibacter sp. S187A]|uniref:baseplate multidomain protein megatron n=1 Tax=Primorskyibacter sp. S187A TaxID=3415130 RepID=UPI003C7CF22E
MATVVLSAVGAAAGSALGGSFLGLSMTAVGRFVGAAAGRMLDQRVMGEGSSVVEGRRIDRIRITRAGEGAEIPRVWGRMRLSGHVIWASHFRERVRIKKVSSGGSSGGGKGAPSQPSSTTKYKTYEYSVSLAVAICEGEIANIARVWADGVEMNTSRLNMRLYKGAEDQLPDPLIEAIEGAGEVPAYRGTAYVVFEDLQLEQFGNRMPQFSFEVVRPVQPSTQDAEKEAPYNVRAVALMPGTGEYALATTRVHYGSGTDRRGWANAAQPTGKSDFSASLDQLSNEMPNVEAVSLIVSWFGDDLRTGQCQLRPKVASTARDGNQMPWSVSGVTRSAAQSIAQDNDGRAIYGGTPADAAVFESIQALNAAGKAVMFYPFILMEQTVGNALPDPYSGDAGQPELPWRGRITTERAPGVDGSPDGTAAAVAEVEAFFGTAGPTDFSTDGKTVSYNGPEEWSYRRFILQYAHLCKLAGGVDSFCIGSEMRGLTQIRGPNHTFPAVEAMRALAADCRAILGPDVKIGYAADWSEYFGYHPQDGSGNVYFHLDPLWADDAIDFIGIDNYMPLSDWRDGTDHADADWGSIYNIDYLKANVAGGEGYDWFYASDAARQSQRRRNITDGAHDEPWVFRYKDLRNWWGHTHHHRIDGIRQSMPTAWEPRSKPIWFTEFGCAAIDKGTNQPNKFLDPKSSESAFPYGSNGARDDLIQRQYLRAVTEYWATVENNPVSDVYNGQMLDMSRAFAWAWDARPFPWFPRATGLWSDGENYARGHWLNGRASGLSLASLVQEICAKAGLTEIDVSQLHGFVRGYMAGGVEDARATLQPLMLQYGFDAVERDGVLRFVMRNGKRDVVLDPGQLAVAEDLDGRLVQMRASEADISGRVRFDFIEAEADYDIASVEAVLPDDKTHAVSQTEVPLALTRTEGRQSAERWLAEARVSREGAKFALPPSLRAIGAGDVVSVEDVLYRIDRVEQGAAQIVDAVRIEPDVYDPVRLEEELRTMTAFEPAVPVTPFFLDLPLWTGEEVAHAPHIALSSDPWVGTAAVYSSLDENGFELDALINARASVGQSETPLFRARPGLIDRGPDLQVRFVDAELSSVGRQALLGGANAAIIGDGSTGNWEIFQFEEAQLIQPNTYLLRTRLRGQAGTDGIMPDVWPSGSWVILLDGALEQLPLTLADRRIARNYRVGPATSPVDDPVFETTSQAFDGIGLRPFKPAHLRARSDGGDLEFSWVRRTRIDGDSWEGFEVPLGEEQEQYILRVRDGQNVRRETILSSPSFTYSAAAQAQDGFGAGWSVDVAQVSASFGPGLFETWRAA